MSLAETDLPFVDEHRTLIAAPRDVVWTAVRWYADRSLGVAERNPLGAILGARPRRGFEPSREVPLRELHMVGRHRFSTYLLVFQLAEARDGRTALSARTYAAFPGPHGRVYRALVIGTHAHAVATRHILRSIRRLSVQLGKRNG